MNRLFAFVSKRFFPIWYAKKLGVKVGKNCRLINVNYSTEPYLISIGDHVSATFCHFETHDGGVWVFRNELPQLDIVRKIKVGNNVFIGYGTLILPGAKIGNNVVIGAQSVVSGFIPDNVVVAGVPARVIKTIDSYKEKVVSQGENTARLSAKEKKNYYLKKYGIY